jgi:hypothetical protein
MVFDLSVRRRGGQLPLKKARPAEAIRTGGAGYVHTVSAVALAKGDRGRTSEFSYFHFNPATMIRIYQVTCATNNQQPPTTTNHQPPTNQGMFLNNNELLPATAIVLLLPQTFKHVKNKTYNQ